MRYTPEEEDFILWLAEAYRTRRDRIQPDEARAELGMDEETFDSVLDIVIRDDLFGLRHGVTASDLLLSPHPRSEEVAREIQARRAAAEAEAADLVGRVTGWARRHKITAALIIGLHLAAMLNFVVGGIYKIVQFLRGR